MEKVLAERKKEGMELSSATKDLANALTETAPGKQDDVVEED